MLLVIRYLPNIFDLGYFEAPKVRCPACETSCHLIALTRAPSQRTRFNQQCAIVHKESDFSLSLCLILVDSVHSETRHPDAARVRHPLLAVARPTRLVGHLPLLRFAGSVPSCSHVAPFLLPSPERETDARHPTRPPGPPPRQLPLAGRDTKGCTSPPGRLPPSLPSLRCSRLRSSPP